MALEKRLRELDGVERVRRDLAEELELHKSKTEETARLLTKIRQENAEFKSATAKLSANLHQQQEIAANSQALLQQQRSTTTAKTKEAVEQKERSLEALVSAQFFSSLFFWN